eukprot:c24871_g1_i1 orf=70-2478(+)
MAAMFGASIFSPSSSPACCQQYGSRLSYCPFQKLPFLKLNDIAHNGISASLSLAVKAQVASVSETLEKTEVSNISETLASPAPDLPERYPHLVPLVCELSEGADVSSAMGPWLEKLSMYDWDALLRMVGGKDWTISCKIVSVFKEKAPLLDESVLWPNLVKSEALVDEREESLNDNAVIDGEAAEGSQASPATTSEDVAEVGVDVSGSSKAKEASEAGSKKISPILKLYKTLAKVLAKNKRFQELDQLEEQIKDEGFVPLPSFYNVMLNFYIAENRLEKVSEVVLKMEAAGFKPTAFSYEKIAHMHMNRETPDLSVPTNIMREMMGRGLPVNVGVFKNLLKAYWRNKDVAGAEEVFKAMQVAGHTPDLKVLLKVMYCHKQTGNYERILELMEMMSNWGIQPNVGVYDQLIYAYCKAGLMEKAKETLLEYKSVLDKKPTLVSLNTILNGYARQGLDDEVLKTFEDIQKNNYRPDVVSYGPVISALVQAEKLNKAVRFYRRMVKQGIQPKLHTYITLIRGHTKFNWTREGRKIANAMRRAPLQLTPAAYGAILALFVEGNWYLHAALVLKEMENESVALDAAANAVLIRSFSILGSKPTPLSKAVEESNLEVCRLLTSLFVTNSGNPKSEPAPEEAVLPFLEKWDETDETRAPIDNAFMDCFWRRGLKTSARKILSFARRTYAKYSRPLVLDSGWVLDVRGLSVGGAKVALIEWLASVGEGKEGKPMNDVKMVLITGDEYQLHVIQDNRILKKALSSMLGDLGSPFVESVEDSKKLEANAADVMKWVLSDKVKELLSFIEESNL